MQYCRYHASARNYRTGSESARNRDPEEYEGTVFYRTYFVLLISFYNSGISCMYVWMDGRTYVRMYNMHYTHLHWHTLWYELRLSWAIAVPYHDVGDLAEFLGLSLHHTFIELTQPGSKDKRTFNGSVQGTIHWNPDLDHQIFEFPANFAFNQSILGDTPDMLMILTEWGITRTVTSIQSCILFWYNTIRCFGEPLFGVPGPHPSTRQEESEAAHEHQEGGIDYTIHQPRKICLGPGVQNLQQKTDQGLGVGVS